VSIVLPTRKKETDDFEKFDLFYDYPAEQQLTGATLNSFRRNF
jgi:hypothetical protein